MPASISRDGERATKRSTTDARLALVVQFTQYESGVALD